MADHCDCNCNCKVKVCAFIRLALLCFALLVNKVERAGWVSARSLINCEQRAASYSSQRSATIIVAARGNYFFPSFLPLSFLWLAMTRCDSRFFRSGLHLQACCEIPWRSGSSSSCTLCEWQPSMLLLWSNYILFQEPRNNICRAIDGVYDMCEGPNTNQTCTHTDW